MAKGKRLVPPAGEAQQQLVEEQHTAQAKLRAAVFNAVGESDVKDIVKGIVERAKSGDKEATKYFFDYILGGRVTTAVQQNVYVDGRSEPDEPTDAKPGSPEKVALMADRFRLVVPPEREKNRKYGRCPGCGARVVLPCFACQIRKVQNA